MSVQERDTVDTMRILLAGGACVERARMISFIQWSGSGRAESEVSSGIVGNGRARASWYSRSRSPAMHLDR